MSTFANVYVGGEPNDLTGDTLRHAFEIINQNFANIAAGRANVTINAPVRSVAGRTGNVLLYVNDVFGAASLANVIAQTNAANTYAATLYATTTSNITANVYNRVAANLSSNIAATVTDLINSGSLLAPLYANASTQAHQITGANLAIATLNANVGSISTSVVSLLSRTTATETNISTLQSSVTTLQSNATTQAVSINSINANVTAANARIRTLDANLGVATTSITTLISNAATQNTQINVLTANAAAQNTALNSLTANAAIQAGQLRTIDANIGVITNTVASLQSNAASQGNELFNLSSNAVVQGAQIRYLDANLGTATTNITGLLSNVAYLQANLAPVSALIANNASQANQIRVLDANLGVATTNIGSQYTEINALRANITAANAAIITANAGMKMYVDGVSSTITANAASQQTAINTINANLGAVTNNITALYANAASQDSAINSTNANIVAIGVSRAAFATYANANIGLLYTSNISTQANLGLFQFYTNVALGAQLANIINITANLGAYQNYANVTWAPVANLNAVQGNLIPSSSNSYSIGSSSKLWKEIYANGNVQTNSFMLAARSIQTPLVEAGNVNANTSLIYSQAIVGNIRTIDYTGVANVGNLITYSGIFWANGVNYNSTSSGNITFDGTTISTADGSTNGIILNSAGAGEIAIRDYTGINNTNPGYWLHIGDGSPGAVNNTGNLSIDFNNGADTVRGSAILDWAWWTAASLGNDNRGTGAHTHFGIYKNDDTHTTRWLEFEYGSGNANIGANLRVSNTITSNAISVNTVTLASAIQLANLTTTQIATISPVSRGMMVYNYTTGNVQVYNGTKWGNIVLS